MAAPPGCTLAVITVSNLQRGGGFADRAGFGEVSAGGLADDAGLAECKAPEPNDRPESRPLPYGGDCPVLSSDGISVCERVSNAKPLD